MRHDNIIFVSKLKHIEADDIYFQQNDVTCHTARETIQPLCELFPGHAIFRSCSCSVGFFFFVLRFLKSKVNVNAVPNKFSHVYAKQLWKISTKEDIASKVVEAICSIFYIIHNLIFHSVFYAWVFHQNAFFCEFYEDAANVHLRNMKKSYLISFVSTLP